MYVKWRIIEIIEIMLHINISERKTEVKELNRSLETASSTITHIHTYIYTYSILKNKVL